ESLVVAALGSYDEQFPIKLLSVFVVRSRFHRAFCLYSRTWQHAGSKIWFAKKSWMSSGSGSPPGSPPHLNQMFRKRFEGELKPEKFLTKSSDNDPLRPQGPCH